MYSGYTETQIIYAQRLNFKSTSCKSWVTINGYTQVGIGLNHQYSLGKKFSMDFPTVGLSSIIIES